MNYVQAFRENWLLLVVLAAFASAFIFLRSPATPLGSTAAFDAALADGTPTIVEFYSDF
jgi:hypothetical protein